MMADDDPNSLSGPTLHTLSAPHATHTRSAYANDWKHYSVWCRRSGLPPTPPLPQTIARYITELAFPSDAGLFEKAASPRTITTIERRLSGLAWNFKQRGLEFDRADQHIASALLVIRKKRSRQRERREVLSGSDLLAMVNTLDHDLRGLRDRAILLIGFAGGLRRSEIVGLDIEPHQTEGGTGSLEILEQGLVITMMSKVGLREVVIGRGSSDKSCPVVAIETWLKFARIGHGPLFRRILRDNRTVDTERLSDKHIARLVKQASLGAGLRSDLPESKRSALFSAHSLKSGLASWIRIEDRVVPEQMDRTARKESQLDERRSERFRVNLTKALGL